jgi:hypothetical protein
MVMALVLAFAAPSWGLSLQNGPIKFIIEAYDQGTTYGPLGAPLLPVVDPTGAALDALIPPAVGALGGIGSEDTWGILTVSAIETASIITQPPPGPGSIDGPGGVNIWTKGVTDGTELVAVFWGEFDTSVVIDAVGTQTATGRGLNFALWQQPFGAADLATPGAAVFGDLGSAARSLVSPQVYTGVGVPGGVAGATLLLTGTATPGFFPGTLDPGASFLSVFNPGGLLPGGITGSAALWLSVGAVDADPAMAGLETGSLNSALDTNFFLATDGSGTSADLSFQITTRGNNVTNTPGFDPPGPKPAGFDWTVTTESGTVTGVAVPEPLTMVGLLFGVAGVGGYLRRRRAV